MQKDANLNSLAKPSPADPEQLLEEAVGLANIPTLLMVLAQLTGERRWLEPPLQPTRPVGISDNDSGGLSEELQEIVRSSAIVAIREWLDGRPVAWASPSQEFLRSMLSVAMAEEIPEEYGALLENEILSDRPRARPTSTPPPGFSVVVVGAGFAGLCAGYRLKQAGIPFTIIERQGSVGGVWWENRYPGAGVDTPSHLYSLSFARRNWKHYFALRDDVQEYVETLATDLGLRPSIRFNTEVLRATYDEVDQSWLVETRAADGTSALIRADALISAVGIFNPPTIPWIEGLERFEGPMFHTARWPDDLDLHGRRVAVVGTGASAMQVVPAIVDEVEELTIFQRSQQWALPFERFRQSVPAPIRWLMDAVPLYAAWYRARLGWTFNDRIHKALRIDPEWSHPERSVNRINDRLREMLTEYIRSELGDRQDLLDRVLPDYPPFGKRILLDNGWFRTLTRDNVELVTDRITEVHGDRIVSATGSEHPADVIVMATGFDVARFVTEFEIVGRGGQKLQELWDDDGRAYLGTTVPGFPNYFCLYGPNLQPGHGGSVILTLERQVHYAIEALSLMFDRGSRSMEVTQEIHDDYNRSTDAALSRMVWTHPGMTTYYRNSRGRIVVNSPYRHAEWWHMTENVNPADYQFDGG